MHALEAWGDSKEEPKTISHTFQSVGVYVFLIAFACMYYFSNAARMLEHFDLGWHLPVFVDGRAATAYPDALLRDYFKLVQWEIDETVWDTVLEKYQIDTVLWVKRHEPLRRFLVDKRGWKEDYTGSHQSIYVKP